jgi:hypothetical protein
MQEKETFNSHKLPKSKTFAGLICTVNEHGIYIFAEKEECPHQGFDGLKHYTKVLDNLIEHSMSETLDVEQ